MSLKKKTLTVKRNIKATYGTRQTVQFISVFNILP